MKWVNHTHILSFVPSHALLLYSHPPLRYHTTPRPLPLDAIATPTAYRHRPATAMLYTRHPTHRAVRSTQVAHPACARAARTFASR